MDLKLDENGDLAIENDDLVLVDGLEAIVQDCEVRLNFFFGEWFLDTRLGVPWFQRILGQKPRLVAVKSIIKKAILTTPGILSIIDFDLNWDSARRNLSIEFRANTVEGEFEYNKELIIS